MNKSSLSILITLFLTSQIFAQTVNPDYVDGVVHFKLNDNSVLELDPYQNTIPALNLLLITYSIDTLYKPFKLPGTALDKVYRIKFSNAALVENLITELELIADVEFAEKIPLYRTTSTPNDFDSQQWNLQKVNAEQAWNITTGSSSVVVAIVDNAVLHSHQDLAANRWINTTEQNGIPGLDDDLNGFADDIYGYDVADSDANPEPPSGTLNSSGFKHGTHVAGISTAATNNNVGVASLGYNCKFMSVKCSPNSSNGDVITNAQDGVFYAMQAGADIISMSYGGSGGALVSELILNQAYASGIVLIAAAGNDNTNTQHFPAAYSNVIAVGATDQNDAKASFSNYGNWVDVMAPGVSIYSTLTENGNTYGNLSGTSMATPLVAGLAALVLSHEPGLTPTQVKTKIQQGCENIDAQNAGLTGQLGAGRINAFHALSPVGVKENLSSNQFHIFPNPVQKDTPLFLAAAEINAEEITVNIVDIAGRLLSSERINVHQQEMLKVNSVSSLATGSYFIELLWKSHKSVEKLVIY
jgi:serine protease